MSFLCALVLLIIISALRSFGQNVTQKERTMIVNQGARISLDCVYDKNVYYLFWYIQPPGKPPRIFLTDLGDGTSSGEGRSHNFQAKHDKNKKSFNMEKSASQLNDSAVYFCAGSDTVKSVGG
uniref:Ig-like domain-containing protein n=1 Tax=Podarcis muralis TaxID=64176 RepID=A0A670JB39_PODMU